MTGWRVGAVIAEPALIKTMQRINGALIYTAPSVSQRAAIQALHDREDIRTRYIREYRERVFYAAERIRRIPYFELNEPHGTFYLFPSIRKTKLDSAGPAPGCLKRRMCLSQTARHSEKRARGMCALPAPSAAISSARHSTEWKS